MSRSYEIRTCKELSSLMERFPFSTGCMVIDTETTGLSPWKYVVRDGKPERRIDDRILQLSAIDLQTGRTYFNDYFKPGSRKRWPEAEQINHISYEKVKDRKTIAQRKNELNALFRNCSVLIGYNVTFDMDFLEAEGIDLSHVRYVIDVMSDFANYWGEVHEYYHTYTWKKLTLVANHFGYRYENAHDSLVDCLATRFVAYMLEECWEPRPELEEFS